MEFDPDRVRLLGDPDTADGRALLADLFDAYVAHMRAALTDMRHALAAGDSARVRALAHEQKGASGMVGAAEIAAVLGSIEAAPGQAALVSAALETARSSLARLEREVHVLVGRPGTA